jgi:hypothetical protein
MVIRKIFIDVFALIYLNKTPTDTLQRILIIKLIIYYITFIKATNVDDYREISVRRFYNDQYHFYFCFRSILSATSQSIFIQKK